MADTSRDSQKKEAAESQAKEAKPTPNLPEDSANLLEYRLAERLEGRVWKALKTRFAPLGAIVAILGFLGAPLILDYVTHRIEGDLERETAKLQQKVEDQLVDMELKTSQLSSRAQVAENELSKLDQYAAEVQKISPQFTLLKAQVDQDEARVMGIQSQLTQIAREAKESADEVAQVKAQISRTNQEVGGLKTNFADTKQAVFGTQLSFSNLDSALIAATVPADAVLIKGTNPIALSRDITLSGQNFGKSKGKVYIQVSSALIALPTLSNPSASQAGAPLELDDASVTDWDDTSVTIHLSDEALQRLAASRPQTLGGVTVSGLSFGSPLFYYQFKIQTTSGESSNWWYVQPGFN